MSVLDDARHPQSAQSAQQGRWTVLELIRWTTSHFAEQGIESPRLDAECLLAHALGCERLSLYLDFDKPVLPAERERYRELVRRRAGERVPVSQLTGQREFWSQEFRVTSDVLTPRPETELLVEAALRELPDADAPYRILDLGTGSGAIALALVGERPHSRVVATDISAPALQIARQNAEKLHSGDGVVFLEGSLFEPLSGQVFDLVVSNPPYLARGGSQILPPELAHEPESALFGGPDGLDVIRPLVAGAIERLVPGGVLIVEMDPAQAGAVSELCDVAGFVGIQILRDLAGRDRAVLARRAGG